MTTTIRVKDLFDKESLGAKDLKNMGAIVDHDKNEITLLDNLKIDPEYKGLPSGEIAVTDSDNKLTAVLGRCLGDDKNNFDYEIMIPG